TDRVVDLVRHARCELSDGRQFVGLEHPVLLRRQRVRGPGRRRMKTELAWVAGTRRANGYAEQTRIAANAPLAHDTKRQPVHAVAVQAILAAFAWRLRIRTQPRRIGNQLGQAKVRIVM